jgi:hypothetical protein
MPHLHQHCACRGPRPPPLSTRPSPPAAGLHNDLHRFNPAANACTALSPTGSGPSRRWAMGFAATPDGMLYVFGGSGTGKVGGGDKWACVYKCSGAVGRICAAA